MKREEVIEEAAKAINTSSSDYAPEWSAMEERQRDRFRHIARAALAVFEKAHTPTDDEREALRVASSDTWGWDTCVVCGSERVTDRGMIIVVSRAEGVFAARMAWCDTTEECRADLRESDASMLTDDDATAVDAALLRSEVPEPSADDGRDEEMSCFECGARNPVWWALNGAWNLAVGGDAAREAGGMLCPSCFHRRWLAATSSEPQGEPSDAHDDDCEAEYVVGATGYTDCECRERAVEAERREAVTAGAAAISAILDDRDMPWNPEVLADAALRAAFAVTEVPEPSAEDERIEAWHYVADHEAFKACYDEEQPLIDSILARITQLRELESTVNELAPAPTLPLEPSDTTIERYLLEEWKHERWGYGDDDVPRCECGDRLHEGDYGPVRSLEQHRVRVSLVAAVTEQGESHG